MNKTKFTDHVMIVIFYLGKEEFMERIASFQVNHKKLNRGIYVSRLD